MGNFMTAIDKDKNNANEATKGNHRQIKSLFVFISQDSKFILFFYHIYTRMITFSLEAHLCL